MTPDQIATIKTLIVAAHNATVYAANLPLDTSDVVFDPACEAVTEKHKQLDTFIETLRLPVPKVAVFDARDDAIMWRATHGGWIFESTTFHREDVFWFDPSHTPTTIFKHYLLHGLDGTLLDWIPLNSPK